MDKFTKEEITDEILSCLNISFITLCPTIIDSIKELQDNPEWKENMIIDINSVLSHEFEEEKSTSENHLSQVLPVSIISLLPGWQILI